MIVLKNLAYLCAILFIALSFHLAAKDDAALTLSEGKAHYVLEAIKHITWPNEDNISHFNIATLSNDKDLHNALNNLTNRVVRGKSIKVIPIEHLSNPNKTTEVIVVGRDKLSFVPELSKKHYNALIISDGTTDKKNLMVGLQTSRNDIKLTINRENLINRGFTISNGLLDFAGTRADLRDQLYDKEEQLLQLNNSLEVNQQALQQVLLDLTNQSNQLLKAQSQLSSTKDQLHLLTMNKEKIKTELAFQKNNLLIQQKLISEKEIEHHQQQQRLQQLKAAIEHNEIKLKQQISTLQQKNSIIKYKEQKIISQRRLLYITTVIIFVIMLLIFLVLRIDFKRKKANKKLYELATTDGMTKLFNRRHFLELAQRELSQLNRTKNAAIILMVDIDHFKSINDNYGHAAGDQAIINVANILQDNLRDYDIVGRFGGEEFAMFLPHSDIDTAKQVAERIRKKAEDLTTLFQNASIKLTVSIGLTSKIKEDKNIDSMLIRADKALYQAKNSGRNTVVVL